MPQQIQLDQIDVDGAVREAHAAAIDGLDAGDTRLSFIKKLGVGGAGIVGGGALLSTLAPSAFAAAHGRPPASFGAGDIGIANYALTLEYLESDFYNVKGKSVGLSGAAKTLATLIGGHEAEHVSGLSKAISAAGGTPAAKPTFTFPVSNETEFLALASVLENTGVSAYNGQGPKLQNKAYLATAGAIVQIEARHAAAINYMIGKSPTPDEGFDKPLEMAAVLKAVKPLIKA